MLKREIKFTDYEGNEKTRSFYFNMTKAELVELEANQPGGINATIERIQEAEDVKTLIALFKEIILMSVGERSDDGEYFSKSDAIRARFAGHPAYSELFMSLATDADAAADFLQGVLPPDLVKQAQEQLRQEQPQDKPLAPPAPPAGDS